jgi:predicted nucleotidyltransferase
MMRLTDHQRSVICRAACECFGASSRVRLYGSRTDDRASGGDIDLFIETDIRDTCEIARAEINFHVQLQEAFGRQQIDLLIDYPGRRTHPQIFDVAEHTAIPL